MQVWTDHHMLRLWLGNARNIGCWKIASRKLQVLGVHHSGWLRLLWNARNCSCSLIGCWSMAKGSRCFLESMCWIPVVHIWIWACWVADVHWWWLVLRWLVPGVSGWRPHVLAGASLGWPYLVMSIIYVLIRRWTSLILIPGIHWT